MRGRRRSAFSMADVSRTLGRAFPGKDADGAIHAASMLGIRVPGQDARPIRQRKRYTQQDLSLPARRARWAT